MTAVLSPDVTVAAQITPDDVAAIRQAGFDCVICNRPDDEVPPELQADPIRVAVEQAGMRFVYQPFTPGMLSDALVQDFGAEMARGERIFAYCRSGHRCSVLWALASAAAHQGDADSLLSVTAQAGYDLESLRPALNALAARAGA